MSTIFENVLRAMAWKKSESVTAERLGMSLKEYQSVKNEIRQMQKEEDENESLVDLTKEMFTTGYTEDLEKGRAEYKIQTSFEPRTAEEIETLIKLDKTKWKLARYSVWNGGREDVWLTSAKVVAINATDENPAEIIENILKNYKSDYKPLPMKKVFNINTNMLELSIADYHIDKMDKEGKTIEQKAALFLDILNNLLVKSKAVYVLDEITFVIGNDWFNSDNYQNTTTVHMNPQDNSCSWDKAYEIGFDTLVQAITHLAQFCNKLNVICVQGNHAKTKEFYLGHALDAYFRGATNINFDRSSANRKIKVYGNTLIGYHHGNCKIDDLPLMLATEFYQEWGKCKYKEVHTGDKHFFMEKDIKGVRVKQLPSLTGADRWHDDNNFVGSIRSALATIYDFEKGKVCEFEERI